jgi:uncharacterized membrane protein YozB (DUF420 family)
VTIQDLPALNATLNATAGCLLGAGYYFIKRKRIAQHRACMIAALVVSTLFLISYVVYHAHAGSKPFTGHGPIRALYFTILITHVILAAVIVPMALVTLRRGLRLDVVQHRRIARWTWPIWMYVSVTGVVIYVMLYRLQG